MRFGICAVPERASELAAIGYDYVEWPLRRSVGDMAADDYRLLKRRAGQLSVRPETWNVMLPADIKVVGPERDFDALRAYVALGFARVAELGGELVVFGSGGSRNIPDGYSADDAFLEFEEACAIVGDEARMHGIVIAIEPLNRSETNLINSVAEAITLAVSLAHPNVRVLSDLYHVTVEAESLSGTATAGDLLAHVHVAAPDRTIPVPGHGEQELRDYFGVLSTAGYDQRVSIEAKYDGPKEAAAGLHLLRNVWASCTGSGY